MTIRRLTTRVTLAALALTLGRSVLAQDAAPKPEEKKEGAAPAGMPSPEEMMKAWMAYATPGEPHKKFESLTGTWTGKVKMTMDATKPPDESEGTMEYKTILGGRYQEMRWEGTMMGQPFTGVGFVGYDNALKKYQSVWMDTAGTGVSTMTGAYDKTGKVLTMFGAMPDPMTGKMARMKETVTHVDADHHKLEVWNAGPDGKLMKSLEITYTRKK